MQQTQGSLEHGEAHSPLEVVERIRAGDELRRPRRYWVMVGSLFALFAIAPLVYDRVQEPYGYLLPLALAPLLAVAFMW